MNDMSTTKKKCVNKNIDAIGNHWTLIRVVNEPEERRVFGYCRNDEGDDAYIPSLLIANHNMTENDIGNGFTASYIENPRANNNGAAFMVQLPLVWDRDLSGDDGDSLVLTIIDDAMDDIEVAINMVRNMNTEHAAKKLEACLEKLETVSNYLYTDDD